ncbi:MAG: hypothetical protein E7L17_12970 [Clostridium sp.]|uniref:hypothetical protein n=1 Tax=Clostridium sp. TaxID=1506 RepID=UPI00291314F4|nr:hypothetical protein [Clostridium sp.]MDU7339013.1 hypothetical protein [Clostridium sp.]
MSKQIRVAIFHNEVDGSKAYAEDIASKIDGETTLLNFRDPRPCAESLPMRASPNVALLLFVDSLEELQEKINILKQLDYIKKQDSVTEVVDDLIAISDGMTQELEEKIAATFYN